MNAFLQSSILGGDFINYRKKTSSFHRKNFSNNVRKTGQGMIPVVVDSVDHVLSLVLGRNDITSGSTGARFQKQGCEYTFYDDTLVNNILNRVASDIVFIEPNYSNKTFRLGFENGEFLDPNVPIGRYYKEHRFDDGILYLLITQETNIKNYLLSLVYYLVNYVKEKFGS